MFTINRTILFVLSILISQSFIYAQLLKDEGRIFISTNNGENWQRADNGFPNNATVNDFAYANGKYFAATDANGIFISSDNLNSWYQLNAGLDETTKFNAVKTFDNKVLAGSNTKGIFISDDEGEHWSQSNSGLSNLTVRCIFIFNDEIFAGTNDGIFVSEDAGKSWNSVYPAFQINGFTSLNKKIFSAHNKGVAVSGDGGKTWVPIIEENSFHNISTDGKQIFGMSYKPELLKTTDAGLQWSKSDNGLPNLYTFMVVNTGSNLLAGQWDGIYKSDNDGDSWTKYSNGLPVNMPIKEILVNDSVVIVGAGMINK